MESNFFSGSENLYKYLVSIGILMLVLTIYYPLREKQELEILKIGLQSELKVLNLELKENKIKINDLSKFINNKNIDESQKKQIFTEITQKQHSNEIKQMGVDGKILELQNREKYINIYNKLFWIFITLGFILVFYGFVKWHESKKIDDQKSKLEAELLELKVTQEQNNSNSSRSGSQINQNNP
ncbi:hypothetical protein KRE43_08575 [Elizabethkingia meningoseptica]|uniref:hypothetical protein n=1 Tax=Elizabethkingia TaxID=308865 RepID=UPI001626DDF7|nr:MULTISPECIES: hypothetical protein [Elizabethkingia]EJK5328670.1 hypothetical protein [Elizabethkingia meningoseptica]MDE5530353.1 hypothetical protein [Elizabethkingia meningoseptica]MDE5533564.1 hypothetical protein [Elizabethkingia meningoseptica]MDE5541897.1 hypothetical protein [Elizabethkingia meningoseptica]WBS76520.1 hypothetical protein PF438_08540 [Elizabethkingia meningoseptica]